MTTEIAKVNAADRFRKQVEEMGEHFLSRVLPPERVKQAAGRVAIAFRGAALRNPELYQVPVESLAAAMVSSALTGLMPGGPAPDVDLIPRKHDGRLQVDWQVSSRGWVKLARLAGWDCYAVLVFKGEHFVYEEMPERRLEHRPDLTVDQTWATIVCAYVVCTRGTERRWRVVKRAALEKSRARAQTKKVWDADPLEMAEKAAKAYALRRGLVPLGHDAELAGVVDDGEDEDRNGGPVLHVVEAVNVGSEKIEAGDAVVVAEPTNGAAGVRAALAKNGAAAKLEEPLPPEAGDADDGRPPLDPKATALALYQRTIGRPRGVHTVESMRVNLQEITKRERINKKFVEAMYAKGEELGFWTVAPDGKTLELLKAQLPSDDIDKMPRWQLMELIDEAEAEVGRRFLEQAGPSTVDAAEAAGIVIDDEGDFVLPDDLDIVRAYLRALNDMRRV